MNTASEWLSCTSRESPKSAKWNRRPTDDARYLDISRIPPHPRPPRAGRDQGRAAIAPLGERAGSEPDPVQRAWRSREHRGGGRSATAIGRRAAGAGAEAGKLNVKRSAAHRLRQVTRPSAQDGGPPA